MRQGPFRTCIACNTRRPQETLLRLVIRKGKMQSDVFRMLGGRGYYLCYNTLCLHALRRRGTIRAGHDIAKEEIERFIGVTGQEVFP